METIDGIEIFPIISFVIFFTLFTIMLVYVIKKDRASVEEVSQLPLDNHKSSRHE